MYKKLAPCVPVDGQPSRCATHNKAKITDGLCGNARTVLAHHAECVHCQLMVPNKEAFRLNPLLTKLKADGRVERPHFGNPAQAKLAFAMLEPKAVVCSKGAAILRAAINAATRPGYIAIKDGPPVPFIIDHDKFAAMKIGPHAFLASLSVTGRFVQRSDGHIVECIVSQYAPWICYNSTANWNEMNAFKATTNKNGEPLDTIYPVCTSCKAACIEDGMSEDAFRPNFRVTLARFLGKPVHGHTDQPSNVVQLRATTSEFAPRTEHEAELLRRLKDAGDEGVLDLSRDGGKRRVKNPGSASKKVSPEEAVKKQAAKAAQQKAAEAKAQQKAAKGGKPGQNKKTG